MRPANTRISSRDDDSLASETERPDLRSMRVTDAGFNRLLLISLKGGERLREILDLRIALYARHVGPGSQCLGDLAAAFHPQPIVHIATLFALCRQSRRAAQVGLVGK